MQVDEATHAKILAAVAARHYICSSLKHTFVLNGGTGGVVTAELSVTLDVSRGAGDYVDGVAEIIESVPLLQA